MKSGSVSRCRSHASVCDLYIGYSKNLKWVALPYVVSVFLVLAAHSSSYAQEWTPLGLEERRIHTIVQRDSVLFVGTDNGVFRRDLRAEAQWTFLNLEGHWISSLWVDPFSSSTLYVGLSVKLSAPEVDASLLKTVDGGANWFDSGPDFEGLAVILVQGRPDDPSILFAVSIDWRVYKTRTHGDSWTLILEGRGIGTAHTALMIPSDPEILYVGGGNIFGEPHMTRSIDGGEVWDPVFGNFFAGFVGAIAIGPSNSEIVYIGVSDGFLYKTTNDFRNISQLDPGNNFTGAILVDALDSDRIIIGGGQSIALSRDGGLTWIAFPIPSNRVLVTMILDDSDPTRVYVGTNAGIYFLELPPPPAAAEDRAWRNYD